jgi:limonene-1,2-epoxide hydrolase
MPRLLHTGDQVRIGDMKFVYEVRAMMQPFIQPTAYGGFNQGSNPYSSPTIATQPPYVEESYGLPQGGYAPYQPAPPPVPAQAPVKKPSRRGLWIALSAAVGALLLGIVAFGVIGFVNRSTPTKTLNAFCVALKSGDYQTAYNQLSSGLQAKFGSEAVFATGFLNNAGLGKIHDCSVSNVDDGVGTGTITYALSGGSGSTLIVDYELVYENGTSKINAQQFISTPTETLSTYCGALKNQDYQTAYDQLSSSQHNQQSEAQFAANFNGIKVTECTVTNVNDTAGTGTLTYTLSNGNTTAQVVLDYTLVKENNVWKINREQKHV